MKSFNHKRPIRGESGDVEGYRPAPVFRLTEAKLGHAFGSDHKHRLVVGLLPGDMLSFKPHKTRRAVNAMAVDLYAYLLRCEANKRVLERARERKARKAERLASERLKRAEKRLARDV